MKIYTCFFPIMLLMGACTDRSQRLASDTGTVSQDSLFPKLKVISATDSTVFAATVKSSLPTGFNAIYSASFVYSWQTLKDIMGDALVFDSSLADKVSSFDDTTFVQGAVNADDFPPAVKLINNVLSVDARIMRHFPFSGPASQCKNAYFNECKVRMFSLPDARVLYGSRTSWAVSQLSADSSCELIIAGGLRANGSFYSAYEEVMGQSASRGDMVFATVWLPELAFHFKGTFSDLEGRNFKCHRQQNTIASATQVSALVMNSAGTILSSGTESGMGQEFFARSEYFVFIKKRNAPHPFMALRVNNAAWMNCR